MMSSRTLSCWALAATIALPLSACLSPSAPLPVLGPSAVPGAVVLPGAAVPAPGFIGSGDLPWQVQSAASSLDGSTNVVAVKHAAGEYHDRFDDLQTPSLVVRCDEGRLRVGVLARSPFDDSTIDTRERVKIVVRVDDDAAEDIAAEQGNDRKSAYVPDPRALLERMATASQVVLQFTPLGKEPITAVFLLGEVAPIVERARAACPTK